MKILSLQISNILSFEYHEDISTAPEVKFDQHLNIIIGENGSGKSTALEVLNFLFKRVVYKQYNINSELYERKSVILSEERKQILVPANNNSYGQFRLEPNWNTEDRPQKIRIKLKLDEIDQKNIETLRQNFQDLTKFIGKYTTRGEPKLGSNEDEYTLEITLNKDSKQFSVEFVNCSSDFGYEYLSEYNYYKEAIVLFNRENPKHAVENLYESFTIISSYRNYHAFDASISLTSQHPSQQLQSIKNLDFSKSLNTSDKSEPPIFGLVRLRVAEKHYGLMEGKKDIGEAEEEANNLPFIKSINQKLKVVNLECKVKLLDMRTWDYTFQFHDLRRNQTIDDINSLSAGQKAITHLVFEAYGRGDLKGGLVIIDEPEIHLHYQFQNEYLQVINELNHEQNCQYILVTHSEALINSSTINEVQRFSLDNNGHTLISTPEITTDQRWLIKILDNTRSTYAFFAKKVLLVEGDSDRYFFKAVIQELFQELEQEIAVLDIGGKGNFNEWTTLFESFGLEVFRLADFDYCIEKFYPAEKGTDLKPSGAVAAFKSRNPDWEAKIEGEYPNNTLILKEGHLETYLGLTKKRLDHVIKFCNDNLPAYLANKGNTKSSEIQDLLSRVAQS